jgi:cytochrome b561/polyisoprenoid-binding protein YceI
MTHTPDDAAQARYSLLAIILHWTIAAAILMQFILATRMDGRTPEAFALFQLHKSIGITILLLSLLRVAWRLTHRPPPEPSLATWERALSRIVHVGFYVIMIAMPLTGWLMVSTSRLAVPTVLYGIIPWPHLPGTSGLAPAQKALAHEVGETGHYILAITALGLLALHVAGALKHQLFGVQEPVLSRMAPGARAGRWAEPRLLVIVAGALAAMGFAAVVAPPAGRSAPRAAAPEPHAEAPPAAPAPSAAPPLIEPPKASPAETKAATGPQRWTVQPGSSLEFATAWGGQPIAGRFQRWTATILFSPEALDGSKVTVSIDLGSVDTGDAQRDEALKGPDWFDTGQAMKAVFTAQRFESKGDGRYVAHGRLDLRGVKRPMDLPFTLRITGARVDAEGQASLDRTAFGVGQGEFAATDQIPGAVDIRFNLKARAAPAP